MTNKIEKLKLSCHALNEIWEENEKVSFQEAEDLINLVLSSLGKDLPNYLNIKEIVDYVRKNEDWDSGIIASWPSVILSDLDKYQPLYNIVTDNDEILEENITLSKAEILLTRYLNLGEDAYIQDVERKSVLNLCITYQLVSFPERFKNYAEAKRHDKVIETDSLDAYENLFESLHTGGYYELDSVAHLIAKQSQEKQKIGTIFEHRNGDFYFISNSFINSLIEDNESKVSDKHCLIFGMIDEFLMSKGKSEIYKDFDNKVDKDFYKIRFYN